MGQHMDHAKEEGDKSIQNLATFPFFLVIPCLPPSNIPHGKYTENYLEYVSYGTGVTYAHDEGLPLTGNASICLLQRQNKWRMERPCILCNWVFMLQSLFLVLFPKQRLSRINC